MRVVPDSRTNSLWYLRPFHRSRNRLFAVFLGNSILAISSFHDHLLAIRFCSPIIATIRDYPGNSRERWRRDRGVGDQEGIEGRSWAAVMLICQGRVGARSLLFNLFPNLAERNAEGFGQFVSDADADLDFA